MTKESIRPQYERTNLLGIDTMIVRYKGVVISLAYSKKELLILFVKSEHEGLGYTQELLKLIQKGYPDKKIIGSVPLHPAMQHIYDKLNIEYQSS